MTPELAIIIAQLLLKYGPAVAQSIVEIFHKEAITKEDWDRVFALASKSYDSYVTEPALVSVDRPIA